MKAIYYIPFLFFIFLSLSAYPQGSKVVTTDTTSFKVFGVCEQCKHRIEEALKIKGIKSAEWNIDSKILAVTFDPSKMSIDKIHNRIAAVGHDTYLKKANDAVYNALPSCCHYREMENMESANPLKYNSSITVKTDSTQVLSPIIEEHAVKGVVLEEDSKGSFKTIGWCKCVMVRNQFWNNHR